MRAAAPGRGSAYLADDIQAFVDHCIVVGFNVSCELAKRQPAIFIRATQSAIISSDRSMASMCLQLPLFGSAPLSLPAPLNAGSFCVCEARNLIRCARQLCSSYRIVCDILAASGERRLATFARRRSARRHWHWMATLQLLGRL